MNRHNLDLARLHTTPNAEAMRARLPDLGESLHNAAVDLRRDCTVKRVDEMLARIKGAESSLMHLRRALAQEFIIGTT